MADLRISDLTDGSPALRGDLVPVSRTAGSATRRVTASSIAALAAGVYNVKDYGAVGDAQGVAGSAINTGTPNLTNAANPWVAADQGKRITIAGAGAAGATLETTILTFVSAGAVTLAANAGTTVASANTHWGTDDTTAVQAAITAAAGVGQVYFPRGNYFTGALNLTNTVGIHLQGTGYYGTQLWPHTSGINFLDFTGSQQIVLKDLKIGAGSAQSSIPNCAILLAPNSSATGLDFEGTGVYVIGRWAKATVYNFAFPGVIWHTSHLFNYLVQAGARTLLISNTNEDSLTSAFATILAGTQQPTYQKYVDCDIEEWVNNGTTITAARAITLKNVADVQFIGCQIVSQKGTAYIDLAGTLSGLAWDHCTFEAGGSTTPTFIFSLVSSPSITGFSLPGNDFNFATGLLTGAATVLDPGTGGTQLNFNSDPKNAIAAGATRYIGGNGDGAADLTVCKYIPVRGILTQLFVGANNAPGSGKNYTVIAWIQDGTSSQAITATISGAAATTAQDIVHYVEVAKFDRVSLHLVTDAGAATVFIGGTLAFLPF